ncbi:MAG: hypothetical protein WAZ94_08075 [Phycisphaerales bacterium]
MGRFNAPGTRFVVLAAAVGLSCASGAPAQSVDLMVTDLPGLQLMGFAEGKVAYTAGLSVCNSGPVDAAYVATTNQHPLWGFGLYRLVQGRFEQIGVSWLRHPAIALAQSCGACAGGNGTFLGPGCSDTTSAGANAAQASLGPRGEVNAATGVFPYPFSDPQGPTGDAIFKRCQATLADVSDTSASYYFEGHVVHPGETLATRENNASYRRATIMPATAQPVAAGPVRAGRAAIYAWRDDALGPDEPDPTIEVCEVRVRGDGLVLVASRVLPVAGGWRYIYAIENISSHRSVSSLHVPGLGAHNPGFHDVAYHSGDAIDGTDWMFDSAGAATWRTAHTHDQLPGANAIRFGMMYTFWFESPAPPVVGEATLGLFRPGAPSSLGVAAWTPRTCDPDVNADGNTDQDDVAYLVGVIGGGANPSGVDPDFNHDGNADQDDVSALIGVVAGGPCP